MDSDTTSETGRRGLTLWLRSPVMVTLPGWSIVAGAAMLLVLVLVAVD